jgi:predicted outer membrane repeat protein
VAIYGGFPSGGGTRNPQEHKTILSGDRYGDDGPNFTNNAENCYNVVTGYGTDATAILDGFTITAGHASGDYDTMDYGGGMNITQGSPTIANCTFSGNYAVYGGGMYNYESNPTITNCTFSGNRVLEGGGMYDVNSSPKVTNCTFSNNRSYNDGGGMDSWGGNPTITDCTFSENYASDDGGGMEVGTATVTNCTFSGNHADDYGGGIYGGSPTVTNCTFISNSANYGGGIDSGDNSRVTNCTFIGNSAYSWGGGINNESVNLTVINCTFSGNYALSGGGMRNLGGNPAITNCSFGGNKAVYGGGMFAAYSNPIVTNCTFSGNSAVGVENPAGGYIGGYGGGIYNHECNQTLTNCILWGNTALQAGNEIFLVAYPIPSHSSTIDINYCDIKGGEAGVYTVNDCILNWGDGNIDVDPMFVRNPNNGGDGWGDDPCTPANEGANDDFGDLRLKAGSPCLDVGDNEAIPAGVTTDVSGNKRMADGDGDIEACGPNTKLLLHLDGTDGAVSTVDSSGHHTPITFLGNAQLNTAEKKLGSASLLFDGNGDYLTIPYSADWNICGSNADNWIIDFWVKMTDYTGTECFMTQYAGTNNRWNLLHIHGSGIQFIMRTGGTTAINAPATAAGEITDTNWHHIALCKVGTLYAIYKDGVKVTSVNDTSTKTFDAALSIGHSSNDLAGRLDEIRITHSGILGDISAAVDMGAYELWDSDGDGIEEGIDKSPTISSNDFIDIPKLSGTITQRGNQILTITDEPDPCGVRIKAKAAGGGTTPAKVSVGGVAITYTLYDGNEVLVDPTSSIRTKVVNGTVEMMLVPLAGPAATTSLSAGNSLIFEDATCTISVPLTNPDVVVIEIEGEEFTLEPGESITFNQPPAADAGPDQTVYAWIDGVAEVTLDGSNSNDADGDALTYKWTWTIDSNTYEANGVSPTIELPVGVHTIQLVVNDGLVDSAPDDVNITVTGPAEASLCITPKVLNRRCFQPKVTAMLRLPKGITKDQIDKNQPLLLYPGEIEADWTWIGRDYDFKCRAWNTTIFASFDKDKLLDAVDANGLVELVVVGRLKTGQYFFGTDYIRVICPGNWPWRRPWWNWRWNRWCHRPFNCRH